MFYRCLTVNSRGLKDENEKIVGDKKTAENLSISYKGITKVKMADKKNVDSFQLSTLNKRQACLN